MDNSNCWNYLNTQLDSIKSHKNLIIQEEFYSRGYTLKKGFPMREKFPTLEMGTRTN